MNCGTIQRVVCYVWLYLINKWFWIKAQNSINKKMDLFINGEPHKINGTLKLHWKMIK